MKNTVGNASNSKQEQQTSINTSKTTKIPTCVILIGIAMALMNISYVMCYTYTAPYLKSIGISISKTGMLMGICEFASHATKLLSGLFSDLYQRRKNIVLLGYLLSVLGRCMLALHNVIGIFSIGQVLDRFGNGTAATPRDAIVSDVAPKNSIGACFGLKRSLAYVGSVLGAICGFLVMHYTQGNYRSVFFYALIPALMAIMIMAFFVKDSFNQCANQQDNSDKKLKRNRTGIKLSKLNQFDRNFWIIIAINIVYMASKISESAIILHINRIESSVTMASLVMICVNIGAMISAYSSGIIGDKTKRTNLIIISIILFISSYIGLYCAHNRTTWCLSVVLWGMHLATSQNAFVSLVAEYAPKELRGTGMGILWLTTGIASYFGDHIIGGYIHQRYGAQRMFEVGCFMCIFCFAMILVANKISFDRNKRESEA